jgi:hypothetical protein
MARIAPLDPRLAEAAATLPDDVAETRPMLRATGLACRGKVFAFADGGDLVLRLPGATARDLVAAGAARPYRLGGRLMSTWVVVGFDAAGSWRAHLAAAHAGLACAAPEA